MGTPIMDTVQNIILDVSKEENQVRVSIKKRDANKWLWRFCLVDDGQPVDLSWAKSACFRAKKPDNTKIWNPCVIRGNVVEYTVTDETVSAAGTLVGEVELTGGHYDSNGNIVGEKLTSACFAIKVLEHTVSDDELTSESEFGVLDKMQMEIAALDDKFPVQTEDIADGTVTPEKTSFVDKAEETIPVAVDTSHVVVGNNFMDSFIPTKGHNYYVTNLPDMQIENASMDEENSIQVQGVPFPLYQVIYAPWQDSPIYPAVAFVYPTSLESSFAVYDLVHKLEIKGLVVSQENIADGDITNEKLANSAVTADKLEAGAVTEDKLADSVKEKLQDGLKRIKVDELPSDEGQVLYRFEGEWDVVNNPSSSTPNLLVKDWGTPLVTPIDLTPITSSKQLRMTVIADATDSNEPSFSGGGVELRNWSSGVETKVSHNMPLSAGPGGNEIAYPLTSFTPQDSDAWSKINGFRVWTYGENTSGSYIMKIRDVRIVDTSVGIDPNAIYIVPSDDPQAGDAHDEYMYIDGAWEKIGGSLADGEVTTQKLANGAVTEDKLSDGAVTVEKTDFAGRKWVFKSVEGELWANYTQESGSTSTGTISTPGGGNYLLYPNTVPQDPSRAFITLHGSSMKAVALSDLAEVSCSDTSYSHGLLLQVPPEYYEFELSIQPEHTSAAGEDTAYYTACSVEEERLLVDGLLVMEENLRDGAVTTTKLADGAVTADKLADGVLDSAGVVQTGTATLTCTSGAASEKFDCSYCKIGNMVTLRGSGYNITTTWGTGVTFTGLPFPCQGVSGFVWKSTSSAGFWGFGYLSGSSLNICKEIAYSPYEGSKTDLTGPYDGTGFTVTYITGS